MDMQALDSMVHYSSRRFGGRNEKQNALDPSPKSSLVRYPRAENHKDQNIYLPSTLSISAARSPLPLCGKERKISHSDVGSGLDRHCYRALAID